MADRYLASHLGEDLCDVKIRLTRGSVEAFDGEAEAMHRAGQQRETRIAAAQSPRSAGGSTDLLSRPAPPSVQIGVRLHPTARKIPGMTAPDPAPSLEDH